jgi:hypothetical protein
MPRNLIQEPAPQAVYTAPGTPPDRGPYPRSPYLVSCRDLLGFGAGLEAGSRAGALKGAGLDRLSGQHGGPTTSWARSTVAVGALVRMMRTCSTRPPSMMAASPGL